MSNRIANVSVEGDIGMSERRTGNEGEVVINVSEASRDQSASPSKVAESDAGTPKPDPLIIPPPESYKFSGSTHKPPKVPTEGLTRRKSLARSVYSKPNSRFGQQQSYRYDKSTIVEENGGTLREHFGAASFSRNSFNRASPNNNSNRSVRSNAMSKVAEEETDENEEIYEKVKLHRVKRGGMRPLALLELLLFVAILCTLVVSLTIDKVKERCIWGLVVWKCSFDFYNAVKLEFIICKSKTGTKVSKSFLASALFILLKRFGQASGLFTEPLMSNRIANVSVEGDIGMSERRTSNEGEVVINVSEASRDQSASPSKVAESHAGTPKPDPLIIPPPESYKFSGSTHKPPKVPTEGLTRRKSLARSVYSKPNSRFGQQQSYRNQKEKADKEITNEMEAVAAAYDIFNNVAQPNQNYIEEDDLLRFMIKEEVDLVLPLIDGGETGKITRNAFTDWVVNVYTSRKALGHSLNDTKTAVRQVDKLITAVLSVITFVIWLVLLDIATTKFLVVMSSQFVGLAFMIGSTCKNIFESFVFVFVMHPYDVGDRCVIDGVALLVEEIDLLTTVFLKLDNEKVFYPNAVLVSKPISNFYRSPDMGDSIEFSIAFATPAAKIATLKEKVTEFLVQNPQNWYPEPLLMVKAIENVNKLHLNLLVTHTMNFQNFGEKNVRRTGLIIALKRILEELEIDYTLLSQEVHLTGHK
ncbi:hypothetical protein F2Q68_00000680 [Brassica cretica]|uniref:Mechanosensitive ion channel protein n=1 Tax=Brassica cretica TaxID=69181 RepID=A0A8S9J7R4_BRACR|nr:hypothetical protein F2Q68_00000680 [Brassica cretica]